ncbi:TPM domain-containing protein [Fulvimonas sp. R45]|uniref:TPM domain-containing protein n=1 Tax=Fulvimonas sp. R45 TaxID=3045937 RepID=UPI00265E02A6|nr:TPM domain-containing protein [Fulvimonas sp. R45]MDO1529794.1 TPM domain-containing protein [Fulvimonas sp. R45]
MAKKPSRRRRTSVSELLGHAATPWQSVRKAMAAVVVLVWSLAAWQLHVHAPSAADNAYVVDDAGVVSPAAGAKLAAALDHLKRQTGVQVLVETVPDLHGQSIEAYAVDEFQRRRLGRKGVDDGVLFVLAPNRHRARIEVGYGLEGVLTDVTASLILRHRVVPAMRNGDANRALLQGAEGIVVALHGTWDTSGSAQWMQQPSSSHGFWKWVGAVPALLLLVVFEVLALNLWSPWPDRAETDGVGFVLRLLGWGFMMFWSWGLGFVLLFFWTIPGSMMAGQAGATALAWLHAVAFPVLRYLGTNHRYRYMALSARTRRSLRPRNLVERIANVALGTAGGWKLGSGNSSGASFSGSSGSSSSGSDGGGSSGGGGASAGW